MPDETARDASDEKLLRYAVELCAEVIRRGLDVPGFIVSEELRPTTEYEVESSSRVFDKPISEWTFCPLCWEVRCDDDCPLYHVRKAASLWREDGHPE